jgi:hypothetical protein
MSESRYDRERPRTLSAEPTVGELIDASVRKIVTAIVIAGGLIALGAYTSGREGPRYQVAADNGRVYRINTDSGTVIACENEHCAIVLEHGRTLEDHLPPHPAAAAPQLPPPAAQPAPAPAATPAASPANPPSRR